MKKNKSFTVICVLCVIPWVAIPLFIGITKMWQICNGDISKFIINLLAIPFIILGVITLFRGVGTVIFDKDQHLFDKYWKYALYIIANMFALVSIALLIKGYFIFCWESVSRLNKKGCVNI